MMAVAVAALPSCKAISSLIHDGEVVARLGDHKLYRSELDDVIPKGTSPEDSVNLANLYINSWVKDKAFLDIAQQRLSKEERMSRRSLRPTASRFCGTATSSATSTSASTPQSQKSRLMNIMAPTKSPSSWSGRSSKPVL